jgi:hypothetical protein
MATSTITNTITDAGGTPAAGIPVVITLMPGSGFRGDASEVARITRTTTDSNGLWSVALERNADISPSGTYYQVVEKVPFAERKWNLQVGSSNQTLFAALTTTPPSIPATQYLTQAQGDARYVLAPGTFGGAPDITTVTPGDTADAGSEDSYARIDHRHPHALHKFQVCTSATRPASPTKGDTIYETDTGELLVYYGATTTWQKPWELPWGIMGNGYATANQGSITNTEVDVTNATCTFTAVANRYYQAKVSCLWVGSGAADQLLLKITDGANTVIHQFYDITVNTTSGSSRTWVTKPFTLSGGSQTVKMRAVRNSGAGTITIQSASAYPSGITVEDVGPAATVPSA